MIRLLLLLLLLPSLALAQARGYQSRACGFDLNFNGVVGEPADCNVCDGVTTDVDGNTVTDDLRYVDCDAGTDAGSCTAGSPCLTPQFALNAIGAPAANQIQAVCIRGTCETTGERTLTNTQNGAAGVFTRPQSGSEAYNFQYPRYPLLISGWDSDNDGRYPPFDTDDTAVFDGNVGTNRDLWFDNANRSRVEVAHLTVRDYLRSCADNVAIIPQDNGGPDHLYFHDLDLPGSGTGCGNGRYISAFGANGIQYHAFENLNWPDIGGFILYRGDATESTGAQFIRWKNITAISNGALDQLTKHWNNWTNVEWLDSHIEQLGSGMSIAQCNQNWTVRNNLFLNNRIAIGANVMDVDSCNAPGRPTDNLIIDRNTFRCTIAACRTDFPAAMQLGFPGSGPSTTYLGATTITNNMFSVTGGSQLRGILIDYPMNGSGTTGSVITIIGNTFHGTFSEGALRTFQYAGSGSRVPSGWVVRNNLFQSGTVVDNTETTLASYSSTGNRWQSGMATDQVTGATCTASFVNAAAGDFHLQSGDTCARDTASDPSGGFTLCTECITWDFDRDARP